MAKQSHTLVLVAILSTAVYILPYASGQPQPEVASLALLEEAVNTTQPQLIPEPQLFVAAASASAAVSSINQDAPPPTGGYALEHAVSMVIITHNNHSQQTFFQASFDACSQVNACVMRALQLFL